MRVSRRRAGWMVSGVLLAAVAVTAVSIRRNADAEVDRLTEALRLDRGTRVADVGAGKGQLALALARRVGADGHVFATEIDAARLDQIRDAVAREGLGNVTVIEAGEAETGLAPACCDAAYLRDVYHHLGDPRAINESLHQAIRPGGRLAVIDFEPSWFLSRFFPVEDVPADRGGHGVTSEIVIEELEAAGFALEERIEDWGFGTFAVVFRRL